jgi:uncharacterized protein YndB with AHSA1/START domain
MQPIVEVRTISRPLTDVYAYLADTRHLAEWIPGASSLKPLAGAPAVGDVVTFDVGRMANSLTFTAVEPPHRLAYDVRNTLVVLPVVIELERIDANATRLTKSQTVEPKGIGRLLGPLLKRGIAQRVSTEADRIKQNLQA